LGDILEYQGREDLFVSREFHAGEFELQTSARKPSVHLRRQSGRNLVGRLRRRGGKMLHLSD